MENGLDFMNQITTVPFAFSRDALDVFGVNAEADRSWFHRFLCLKHKGCKIQNVFYIRFSVVREKKL
ncbi:hypothetical protein OA86_10785 [Kaistella jeonii]|uniref:Uncharacterized protein n=1 Tax=Kaistella jeonii TaxID=266749 RepID=A0A0C1F9C9_9FLAO|nr:hypothetical protein OA86_10785 [Kaistella jeonii]